MKRMFSKLGVPLLAIAIVCCSSLIAGNADSYWWHHPDFAIVMNDNADVAEAYAIANVGQLKFVAYQAKRFLDDALEVSDEDWNAAYGGMEFNPFETPYFDPSDPLSREAAYSPANVGQAKAIAVGFYGLLETHAPLYDLRTRFAEIGLETSEYTSVSTMVPWTDVPVGENYAPLNVGQLKVLFSFMPSVGGVDSDRDGMSDWWETYFFGDLEKNGLGDYDDDGFSNAYEIGNLMDPTDRLNGVLPTISIVSGSRQSGSPGEVLPVPLSVRVFCGEQLLDGLSVVFETSHGLLDTTSGADFSGFSSVEAVTDQQGMVSVWLELPDLNGQSVEVAAQVSTSQDRGLRAIHNEVTFFATVESTIDYTTGFEQGEGFALAPIDGQSGWRGRGAASVSDSQSRQGTSALTLGSGSGSASLCIDGEGVTIVTCEFSVFLSEQDDFNSTSVLPEEAVALVSYDGVLGLWAFDGNGNGNGSWKLIPASNFNDQWVDVKIVAHYDTLTPENQYWELWVNGIQKHASLGFKDNSVTVASTITFENHKSSPAYVDALSITD